ncbi:hypothetical protein LB507_010949, partial [Fusarium sp. FIESC RH6]
VQVPRFSMDEESETTLHAKRKGGKRLRRKKHLKVVQPRIRVSVGSVTLCGPHCTASQNMNSGEQRIIRQFGPKIFLSENDPYLSAEESDDEDFVNAFMTKDENEPRPPCQVESIKAFCCSDILQELKLNSPSLPSTKACLVDDMTSDGSSSTRVGVYKPLTVWETYHKLKQQRFHRATPHEIRAKVNIDRRLIYGLAALMTTASRSQAVPLMDFFYDYISFSPNIRLLDKSPCYTYSSQQFHLPFYSWRRTKHKPEDNRRKTDGSPFRNVSSMQFLRDKSAEIFHKVDYLCEGQISVLISVIDQRVYTGYCFIDTYCQPESRNRTVEDFWMSDMDEDYVQTDPFLDGRYDSNKPILDPTEYFLTTLDTQLGVFRNEWANTIFQIDAMVQDYITNFSYSSPELRSSSSGETRKSTAWLRQTRDTLNKLIASLESTIHCWDNHIPQEQSPTFHENRCLKSIQKTFSDLKTQRFKLKNVLKKCDEHERNLNLENVDAQKEVSELQTTATLSNQTATNILLQVISPITVAAAMLSMQEKAIPSILGPNKLSFFVLAPILCIVASIAIKVIHSWERIVPVLGGWTKRHKVEGQLADVIELVEV